MNLERRPVCLTISGLDPSGGAGAIADIKTFSTFGCFAAAAISSLTFQNTTGIFGAIHQTAESIRGQIEPVLKDFEVAAVKTGMLPVKQVIEETANLVSEFGITCLVVDPVIRSTSGFDLIDEVALTSLVEKLFPLSLLVTPNLPEAERITKMQIRSEQEIETAARAIQALGARNVLIKGGHTENLVSSEPIARDFLFIGNEMRVFEAEYIQTSATHGTGCCLSAAITANLALGKDLAHAVDIAKRFVTEAIRTAPNLGHGNSPINIQ